MSNEGHMDKRLPRGAVLGITAAALAVATFIVFAAILPAEFNKDPLSLGKVTGLDRLWAPEEVASTGTVGAAPLAREYTGGFRSDVINIPLSQGGDRYRANQLEYKVTMKKDATLIYEWSVEGEAKPEEFYSDFHGHTLSGGAEETVATYRAATGTTVAGALTAPFDGVHGWYVENRSSKPVVVHIKILGFYDLVPLGDTGNESGINANVPAERAFDLPPELQGSEEPKK